MTRSLLVAHGGAPSGVAGRLGGARGAPGGGRCAGSPNQWGDSSPVELPAVGLTAHVAVQDVQVVPADMRLAVMPDLPVDATAADFLARDPDSARALR